MVVMEYLANLFDAILATFFVLKFNNGKIKENKTSYICAFLCFVVSTAFLYISDLSLLHTVIITLLLIGFAFTVKGHKTLSALLAPLLFECTLAVSSIVFVISLSMIFNIDVSVIANGFTFARCLLLLLTKGTEAVICAVILRFIKLNSNFKFIELILYLLAPAITVASIYAFLAICLVQDMEDYYVLIFVSSIGLIITNVLAVLFFLKYQKNEQDKNEMKILLQLQGYEQQKYDETQKINESIKILRHDLKEQLIYARRLFDEGNAEEAWNHIKKLEDRIFKTTELVQTGNRVIDSILASKILANPEIKFIVGGSFGELENAEDIELVSLFSNMLENAVEATKDIDNKLIEISFSEKGGYQNISCKNPILDSAFKDNPHLVTTKKDKAIHGYGIKSMEKSVKALNGMIEFYESDGCFCCHVALPTENAQ